MRWRRPDVRQDVPVKSGLLDLPGDGSPAGAASLTPTVRHLVERCAGLRRGLAFLNGAPPEYVAVALQLDVRAVEEAQACLQHPARRAELIREYARALERPGRRLPGDPVAPPARSLGPEELIREAERHPLGVQFVLAGAFETVAVTFAVHPDVVLGARELLARSGVLPEVSPAEQ